MNKYSDRPYVTKSKEYDENFNRKKEEFFITNGMLIIHVRNYADE